MNLPFCSSCLETAALCPACKRKLDKGELKQTDLDVSRALHSFRQDYPLEEAVFTESAEVGPFVALFTPTPSALIGKGGRVAKRLGEKLGKRVKIIDSTAAAEAQLNELLLPVRVQGVNRVYRSDGEKVKVRFNAADRRRLPIREDVTLALARRFYGETAEIIFE